MKQPEWKLEPVWHKLELRSGEVLIGRWSVTDMDLSSGYRERILAYQRFVVPNPVWKLDGQLLARSVRTVVSA